MKSNKRVENHLKYSDGTTTVRPYIYNTQLSFLNKLLEPTERSICSDVHEFSTSSADTSCSSYTTPGPSWRSSGATTSTATAGGEEEEYDEAGTARKIARMDFEKEDPKVMFFKGVLPNMADFTEDENLQFQSGVIYLIQTIRERRHETK